MLTTRITEPPETVAASTAPTAATATGAATTTQRTPSLGPRATTTTTIKRG